MKTYEQIRDNLVVVRGAGDLATGVIIRLHRAGFAVMATEIEKPTVIRRTVSFAQALFDEKVKIEGIVAKKTQLDMMDVYRVLEKDMVAVVVDPEGECIQNFGAVIVVDAILAKKNLGTNINMAPLVVALGPGFTAGVDCHYVIETQRGHNLGRVISKGEAAANTGIPGVIGGVGKERVIHSPSSGVMKNVKKIGALVKQNQVIANIETEDGTLVPVKASISGCLRGLLQNDLEVFEGMKIADIDPRNVKDYCKSVSDKARAIAGGVLEVACAFKLS